MIWHCQKELDKGSSAPDKPVSYTLELTSAHPIRLRSGENKAHRGTKYTGEPLRSGAKASPRRAYPNAH